MRVGHISGQRQPGSNSIIIQIGLAFHETDVDPHGVTSRFSYTVPTGRRSIFRLCNAYVIRSVAASQAGRPEVCVDVAGTPIAYCELVGNVVGATDRVDFGTDLVLLSGQTLTGITMDDSTGGTCDYNLVVWLNEYTFP